MSTQETSDERAAGLPRHCEQCGGQLGDGRFCPGCGHETADTDHGSEPEDATVEDGVGPALEGPGEPPVDAAAEAHDARADDVLSDVRESAPTIAMAVHQPVADVPAGRAFRRRGLLIGVAVVAVLAIAAAAAAFVVTNSKNGDDELAYRRQVASAFGPVLGGNREVSLELSRLRGTRPSDASAAVRRARQATTIATGAVGAFIVPRESEQLARDARQVLDREDAYLAAVAAVLAKPSNPTRSQLQSLSGDLTSAMSAAGPTIAGRSQTVSGADRLVAWAPRASRAIKHRAAVKAAARRRAAQRRNPAPAAGGTSTATRSPLANGSACGGGVYAGPNTSCEFARNVYDAYNEAPGATASVRAFSPATGTTYTMYCSPSGSGVTCSGGNNASVAF